MRTFLRRFGANQCGVTSIEYALVAVIVSVTIIVGIRTIGDSAIVLFDYVAETAWPDAEENSGPE